MKVVFPVLPFVLLRHSSALRARCFSRSSLRGRAGNDESYLADNLKWSIYVAPFSNTSIAIAEAIDIDPIIDFTIDNNLPEPFGIVTWNSSFTAADQIDQKYSNSDVLHGKEVCDLGSGTALASLLCFSHGANVTALDFSEISLQLGARSYAKLNEDWAAMDPPRLPVAGSSIRFAQFDMEAPEQRLPRCDLLVISDVSYYEHLAVAVAQRAHEAVTRFDAQVLITDPGRNTAATLLCELRRLLEPVDVGFVDMQFQSHTGAGFYLWLNARRKEVQ
jgi:predicted nicotinamide N-methyase